MNTQGGFLKLFLIVIIGAGAALYFVKDDQGVRYIDVLIASFKDKANESVDGYKNTMEQRDKEIMENLE